MDVMFRQQKAKVGGLEGSSLVVQWLGLGAVTAQALVGEI